MRNVNVKIYNSLMVRLRLSHIQVFPSPNYGLSPQLPELSPQIPNVKDEPVQIQEAQNIAQIWPAIIPEESITQTPSCEPPSIPKSYPADFSTATSLDPDGMLSSEIKNNFRDISKRFQSFFNPNFGVYNDKSSPVRANINLSPVEPPTRKGKLPF